MDFTKLKKEELLNEIKKMQTLPSVIQGKNKEILDLKSEIEALKKTNSELTALNGEVKILKETLLSKDLEIQKVIDENNKNQESYKKEFENFYKEKQILEQKAAENVSNVKKSFEDTIINKDLQIQELNKKVATMQDAEKLKSSLDAISNENKILVKVANAHLSAFRNLMKSIQGTLDNAIELESIITDGLKNPQGGHK